MDIRFLAPELRNLDALKCEAIVAAFFSDERPLTGALGLVDWRLCGFLSEMMVRGSLTGSAGQDVLVPLRPRLTVDKLFMFGLGASSSFTVERLVDETERMLRVLERAKVRTAALVLPGRNREGVSASAAMEALVSAAARVPHEDELILLEPPAAQREMEPIVQRERRRARAVSG